MLLVSFLNSCSTLPKPSIPTKVYVHDLDRRGFACGFNGAACEFVPYEKAPPLICYPEEAF